MSRGVRLSLHKYNSEAFPKGGEGAPCWSPLFFGFTLRITGEHNNRKQLSMGEYMGFGFVRGSDYFSMPP